MLYFLGIDKAKFRRPVIPGDRLDLEVSLLQQRTNVWKLHGEAFVDGSLCAQAELLASVVERNG
jgi:3-hydroxyacyl-[acyl-carrier-protein] dehydratase